MKLYQPLLLIFLVIVASSCVTVPKTIPIPELVLPADVVLPVLVRYDLGVVIIIDMPVVEADYYIINNPKTIDNYRHNLLVMMSYAKRLEDYIKLIKDQIPPK